MFLQQAMPPWFAVHRASQVTMLLLAVVMLFIPILFAQGFKRNLQRLWKQIDSQLSQWDLWGYGSSRPVYWASE